MKTYNKLLESVKVFYQMPNGWKEIWGAQTAPSGYVCIFNGKSILSRKYQQALLKVNN